MTGTVYFIGAGPGAPDLITVRGRVLLERADVVITADSLVHPDLAAIARPGAEVHGSASLTLEQVSALMIGAARAGKSVARLHSGDPSIYGAIHEQMVLLERADVPYAIVPGVSSAFAAAALLGTELTVPGLSQTVIFTRAAGRTGALPPGEELASLASHGASLALFLSAALLEQGVADLIAGGYTPDTPSALVYRATWEDQHVIRGPLNEIPTRTHAAGVTKQAILLVGAALDPDIRRGDSRRSHLYDPGYSHGRRVARRGAIASPPLAGGTEGGSPLPPSASSGRGLGDGPDVSGLRAYQPTSTAPKTDEIAIIAATRPGQTIAARLAGTLSSAHVHLPSTTTPPFSALSTQHSALTAEHSALPLSGLLQELFNTRRKIVLVLAVGAAVRLLAPLLNNKRRDPAVVVVDDAGRFAISLVGGHRAEANALAEEVAAALGGQAVITTAADALGLPTVERLGQEHGWRIENDGPAVTRAATALVNGERLGIVQDAGESDWWTGDPDRLERYASLDELAASDLPAALVITDRVLPPNYAEHLDRWVLYRPRSLVLGVGCSRGAPREAIAHLVNETLAEAALAPLSVRLVGTIDRRGDEPGLLALAHEHGWPLRTFASSELQGVDVPTPSAVVRRAVGTASVSEAAALLAAEGGPLLVTKRKNRLATVAIARWRAP